MSGPFAIRSHLAYVKLTFVLCPLLGEVSKDVGPQGLGGASRTPAESILALAGNAVPAIRATGNALLRLLRLNAANERHRPHEPHWYLHLAGCDPAAQGRGLGGAVIRAGIARAQADGVPTYLETGKEAKIGLYRNFGFDVLDTWQLPDGPTIWSMLRPSTA